MAKIFTTRLQKNLTALIFVSMCFALSACSASDENLSSSTEDNVEKITIQNDDGETIIKIQGDKILSVQKNGKEFSEDEKNIYIQELQSKPGFFTWYDVHPKFDFDKFKVDMKHFCDDSPAKKFHINFNNEEFQAQMEELDSNLQNIKIEFPEMNINLDDDHLEKVTSELSENLEDEMDKLDFNLSEFNLELKKLNNFISDVKSEMVKDGILNNEDEVINIDFDSDEIKINGKVIPEELKEKYKAMFEKQFDEEFNEHYDFHFQK